MPSADYFHFYRIMYGMPKGIFLGVNALGGLLPFLQKLEN